MKPVKKILLTFSIVAVMAVNACGQNHDANATQENPTAIVAEPTAIQQNKRALQLENNLPVTPLTLKPSRELEDNRIGGNAETEHIDARVWNLGAKWMRVIIDSHGEWQHADWDGDEYSIHPDEEVVIDDLVHNGIKIMLVLDVWHTGDRTVYYKSEEDIATYTNWVRFMVRRFKGRIDYYEILNEPNLDFNAPSGMPVDTYVNLVEHIVPVIREEDPDAKIVVGAVPDTRFNDARKWIWDLLDSGVMPLVDGLSWHGMYGAAPATDRRGERQLRHPQVRNYWENYPAYVEEIKSSAASNGFEGEYMTEEMLWRTPAMPHETEPDRFTDVSAAKYYARSIIIHLGLDVAPGLALPPDDDMPRSYSVVRTLCTIMAGAQAADVPVMIENEAGNIAYYGFALSNGDKLLAIWNDGAAVDDDTSMSSTLTMNGISTQKVIVMDVLNGLEQELMTEAENGNLTIRNLLIKDYPIIIKFTDTQ